MNLGKQQIDLSRTSNGIITFPIQSSKPAVSLSVLSDNNVSFKSTLPSSNITLFESTLKSSADITTPSHGKIESNHGKIAPNHGTIAPSHEATTVKPVNFL
jgi:hypothetical protein